MVRLTIDTKILAGGPGEEPARWLPADCYRELFDQLPQAVLVLDCETGKFLSVNGAATRLYGYAPAEFLALSLADLEPPAHPQGIEPQAGGLERQHRHKNGKSLDVQVTRLRASLGGKSVELLVCSDISASNLELQQRIEQLQMGKRDLERRFEERAGQLEALNKELEAFSHSVSHDLRAPLRSVRGFSEVLLERYADKLDAAGRNFLRRARDSCEAMDNLITDLLRFSRVSQGELKRQEVDLSKLAESVAKDLRHEQPERKVHLSIAPGLKAQGDERLLRIVLDNLLRNAWKFTSKRPDSSVEFGAVSDPQQAFFVRDNGAGFDMEYADKMFGVFQRLHSSRDFPGTGVGLATVQRVINRHGGRIWALGSPDAGATFYFTLPESAQSSPQPGLASLPKPREAA